ncbi:type I restriction-modification enzyme R subunit C-terminal domain-containing protein [Pseudomonas syringae]|uniref:type I restriction-modification enzyme R subunit C-terminal domain-containing protein n=1 Tax=Pseudomonas syringae TaxID=317 RepID=UPI00200B0875|nr:hypothetical protein [Pseudomonas syringae pv. syringae]
MKRPGLLQQGGDPLLVALDLGISGLLIRSLVGLDRNAAKEAFGQFLDENRYSSRQIRFIEMIIERLTRQGVMEAGQLYEPPFTALHHEGLDGAFGDADANAIISVIASIKRSAAA